MAMRHIGQVLIDLGHLTEEQLESVLEEQRDRPGELFGMIAVAMGLINEDHLAQALAEQFGLRVINMTDMVIQPDVLSHLTEPMAQMYRVIPIAFKDDVLTVATCDPQKLSVVDELRSFLGYEIRPVVATEQEILAALDRFYGASGESVESLISDMEGDKDLAKAAAELERAEGSIDLTSVEALAESAPVRKLLNMVMLLGIRDHASDLHFEPFETEFKIRLRSDGVLYEMVPPPRHLAFAITTRIKVMANLDIAERRLPQDGRIRLTVGGHPVDLRVSVLPTMFGESVVCRILDRSVVMLDMEMVGLEPEMLKAFRKVIRRPNGIVLVTGPTGSGKTTTLYSCLQDLNQPNVNIVTTEDPVEYQLAGINQVQINEDVGLTFANALRAILRQDPDIVMVGEIRDQETAAIAVKAALTGHLVLSTLHTNDAAGAITRMRDMGLEAFLLASSIIMAQAQRLFKKLCPACKKPATISPDYLRINSLDPALLEGAQLYTAAGCSKCSNTGFKSRSSLMEVLIVDDAIRQLILANANSGALTEQAVANGMLTLRMVGLEKVKQGISSLEEILSVTGGGGGE